MVTFPQKSSLVLDLTEFCFQPTGNLACTTGSHLKEAEMRLMVDLGTSWRLLKQTTQLSAQETKYCVSGTRLTVTFTGVPRRSVSLY